MRGERGEGDGGRDGGMERRGEGAGKVVEGSLEDERERREKL